MRMFLRTTLCFKDMGMFKAKESLYGDEYSGNHIAIFECELKAPPQLSFIDHNYSQYLDAYRMNFRNWKIVDIDNFMDGNHFFNELQEESIWESKMKQTIGEVKIWKENEQKSNPHFEKDILMPFLDQKV